MMRDYKVLPQTRNVRGALAEMVTLRSVIKLKKNDKKRKKRRRRRRKKAPCFMVRDYKVLPPSKKVRRDVS